VATSLDVSVRIFTRHTRRGWRYEVVSRSLAEDIRIALAVDQERLARNGWQRRKRLLKYAVPGVVRRLSAGRRVRLLTLPYPGASMETVGGAWKLMAARLLRECGELQFCGTRAIGARTGNPHVHVLCDWGDHFVPQAWLAATWLELAGFQVVDVREVKSEGAARYVAANVAGYLSQQAGGRMFRSARW